MPSPHGSSKGPQPIIPLLVDDATADTELTWAAVLLAELTALELTLEVAEEALAEELATLDPLALLEDEVAPLAPPSPPEPSSPKGTLSP